jgi:hypothetical protein
MQKLGTKHLLSDIVQYCFAGEPISPPAHIKPILHELIAPAHAITIVNRRNI